MTAKDKARLGRPPALHPNKSRNIRLTDQEWEIFCLKLGPAWLREQIRIAANQTN